MVRRYHPYRVVVAGLLILVTLRVDVASRDQHTQNAYHNDLLNRLHHHFFVRQAPDGRKYGADELDPLLWHSTKYLLEGTSHSKAIALLDEFLATRTETSIDDPLKRAVLQRDLWAIFDWLSVGNDTHSTSRRELQVRLAEIIKRLSLPRSRLLALPDNYAQAVAAKAFPTQRQLGRDDQPFLPPDLFQSDGPWVCISNNQGEAVAATHSQFFGGRSTFLVFVRLPAGRESTVAYLRQLREFPQPWVVNSDQSTTRAPLLPNPRLPQFPAGSEFALVRQLNLIDDQGVLTATRLTESVQIRQYRAIPEGVDANPIRARESQGFYKFTLNRAKLFAGEAGGLSPVTADAKEFALFMSQGIDWFEMQAGGNSSVEKFQVGVIKSCAVCHAGPGVHSVLSYSRRRFAREYLSPPALRESNPLDEASNTTYWKTKQYDWGLLQGLWHSRETTRRVNSVKRF